jgi:hypothetical protein
LHVGEGTGVDGDTALVRRLDPSRRKLVDDRMVIGGKGLQRRHSRTHRLRAIQVAGPELLAAELDHSRRLALLRTLIPRDAVVDSIGKRIGSRERVHASCLGRCVLDLEPVVIHLVFDQGSAKGAWWQFP